MQNTMGQELINKSLTKFKTGISPGNVFIRNLINEYYYFGYKWKDRLDKLTNYTHTSPMYKLIIDANTYLLANITTQVVIQNFKIINADIYICIRNQSTPNDFQLTQDYQDNISIIEKFMLNENNKNRICKYEFKILENDGIFSMMDSNYNILKHDDMLESSISDGYIKSSINISSLLNVFIIPNDS